MQLSPYLAAAIRRTPLFLIQHVTTIMFRHLLFRHPRLFERLGEYRAKRFAFVPTDLPLAFSVHPATRSITASRELPGDGVDSCVKGPLFGLLALLEGRCDADALFFSRDLAVVGDMEAMLAMRNALDDTSIDLPTDLSDLTGPLSPFVRSLLVQQRQRALKEEAF
jgi:O2-independent ubiquinone biosynthesis accessory factor UbiT